MPMELPQVGRRAPTKSPARGPLRPTAGNTAGMTTGGITAPLPVRYLIHVRSRAGVDGLMGFSVEGGFSVWWIFGRDAVVDGFEG